MRNWNKTIGIIFFFAAMAVYSGRVGPGSVALGADPATQAADPFAPAAKSAGGPAEESRPAGAPPKITLSDAGTFSIQINNDVPLVEVLRMIGSQAQISIIPSKDVRGSVPAMDLYNVTVNQALDAILQSNGFAYEQKGNIIYVYSQDEMDKRQKKNLETDIYRLYYISSTDALNMIKPVLSAESVTSSTPGGGSSGGSGASSGGSSSSSSSGSSGGGGGGGGGGGSTGGIGLSGGNSYANIDMLVISDHPENQEKIRKILKELDHRPKQILVEATILEAELTENNQLGVNMTVLGSINFADLGVLPATGASTLLTGSSTGTTATAGLGTVPASAALKGFSSVQTGQGGLQIGVVKDDFAVFLNALESVTNATVLSNPKVLTLDKQQGSVHIGETIYYEGSNTATATTNTVSATSLDTGITLTFVPYIGDDGYIRMEIDPSDSTPQSQTTQADGLPPNVFANEVSSNIMVKDGHTVLIGGLFSDNSSVGKAQVPFFGNLPLAGPLLGQQSDSTDRREIIFLLTPHIVKDDESFSQLSEEEQKNMERMRVGVRQGMMPWGRERLAETCYESAETELRKPNPDLNVVRWHLDCATNLNPTFLEAITLKEKLTGQQLTTSDNSSIRSFVRRQMLVESPQAVSDYQSETPDKSIVISASKHFSPTPVDHPTTQPGAEGPASPFLTPVIAETPTTQPTFAEIPATQPTVAEAPTTHPTAIDAATDSRDETQK